LIEGADIAVTDAVLDLIHERNDFVMRGCRGLGEAGGEDAETNQSNDEAGTL
jgi:hypothetical protein